MLKEAILHNPIIIYNHLSGISGHSPGSYEMALELARYIHPSPIVPLDAVITLPELLDKREALVVGGDGTITSVAKLMAERNPDGWILPVKHATVGTIPDVLGIAAGPMESNAVFIRRTVGALTSGNLILHDIHAGSITSTHDGTARHEPFVFMAGTGQPSRIFTDTTEQLRGKLSRSLRFFMSGLVSYIRTQDSRSFTVEYRGIRRRVLDAQVFKKPFHHNRLIPKRTSDSDTAVMYNDLPVKSRLASLALDLCAVWILRKLPVHGALSYIPMREDDSIIIWNQSGSDGYNVDSEKNTGGLLRITGTDSASGVIYRFAGARLGK